MLFYKNFGEYVQGQREKLDGLADANIPEAGLISRVLGPNDDKSKSSHPFTYSITHEVGGLELYYKGILDDRHYGVYSPSTGREMSIFPKGTIRRNHRHLFAVSFYDCRVLSQSVGVEVTPELLGANLVIDRTDNEDYSLSELPENTYLMISSEDVSERPQIPIAVLRHYAKQRGCKITGKAIAERYSNESLVGKFIKASKNNRGITCSVEYPVDKLATLKAGQKVFFMFSTGVSP